jgi:hypothetical protein
MSRRNKSSRGHKEEAYWLEFVVLERPLRARFYWDRFDDSIPRLSSLAYNLAHEPGLGIRRHHDLVYGVAR